MHSQYLGNFILNKGYLTREQLIKALEAQQETHVKIGVLALGSGMLNSFEIQDIYDEQRKTDKRFGEVAVLKGYLEEYEVEELLGQQKGKLILVQAIVDKGYKSLDEMGKILEEYNNSYGISREGNDHAFSEEILDRMVEDYTGGNIEHKEYIKLLIRNINRFMDSFVLIRGLERRNKDILVGQSIKVDGEKFMDTRYTMTESTLRNVSESFNVDKIDVDDKEIFEEFINMHNGMYIINKNEVDKEGKTKDYQLGVPYQDELNEYDMYTLQLNKGVIYVTLDMGY